MAKMFYTLDETAQQLKVSPDDVKRLAAEGKLQQFRDRDKLMFKRDQVDALATQMAAEPESAESTMGSGPIELSDSALDSAPLELDTSGDTDAIKLADSTVNPEGSTGPIELADSVAEASAAGSGTGQSVFDSGEVEAVDPSAKTEVRSLDEEAELSLESIGSGSGLLDLTHESDDTSLGAELLDEIMPSGTGVAESPPDVAASSGILEQISAEAGTGLDHLATAGAPPAMALATGELYDPQGSALSAGFLVGALAALVIGLMAAVAGVMGVRLELLRQVTTSTNTLLMAAGGLLVAALLFGGIGWLIGKKLA